MTTPEHRNDTDQPRGGVRGKIDELLHGRADDRPDGRHDTDLGPDGSATRTDRPAQQAPAQQAPAQQAPAQQAPAQQATQLGAPQHAAPLVAPDAGPTVPAPAPAPRPADGDLDGTGDRDKRPDDGRLGSDGRLDQDGLDDDSRRTTDPTANAAGPAGVTGSRTVDGDRPDGDRPNHATASTPAMGDDSDGRASLVPAERVREYGTRWDAVKGAFVDEPRQAVAQADALVGELLDELERLFRDQRRDLEHGLDTDETSTEDLRLALRRYRSFFDRLLTL